MLFLILLHAHCQRLSDVTGFDQLEGLDVVHEALDDLAGIFG